MATPYQTLCDLPQLGGDYLDPAHRPSGHPSLTLRCPLVPVETLNEISARTHSLAVADAVIRAGPPAPACNLAVSCPCLACVAVRNDFLAALKSFAPVTNTQSLETSDPPLPVVQAPLPPKELPPLPPSTLPPRFGNSDKKQPSIKIPASVPEHSPLVNNAPLAGEVPINIFDGDIATPSASFRSIDLPLLVNRPLPLLDEESKAASEEPSDGVTHISSCDHQSLPGSASDADWLFTTGTPRPKEDWLYDETDILKPNRFEMDPILTANAVNFDMRSIASDASWIIQDKKGVIRRVI